MFSTCPSSFLLCVPMFYTIIITMTIINIITIMIAMITDAAVLPRLLLVIPRDSWGGGQLWGDFKRIQTPTIQLPGRLRWPPLLLLSPAGGALARPDHHPGHHAHPSLHPPLLYPPLQVALLLDKGDHWSGPIDNMYPFIYKDFKIKIKLTRMKPRWWEREI